MTSTTPARHTTRATPAISSMMSGVVERIEGAARRLAPLSVRFALATIMLWFGIPKLIPGGSPAEDIAVDTIAALTGGLVHGDTARILVGGMEVLIGLALVIGRAMPIVLLVVLAHMAGTFAPLALFPELTWHGPAVGSLEGQYIIKNVMIIAGVIVLAGHGLRRPATRN